MYDGRSGRAPGVRNPLQQSYHHGVNNLAMMYNREGFLTERQMKRDAQERHRAELEKQIEDDRRRKAEERRKLKEEDDHWNARSVGMAGMRTPPRRVNDSAQTVPQPTPAAPPRQVPQPSLLSLPTPAFAPSPHPPSNLAVPASRVDFTFHPPPLSAGEDDPPGHALTQLLAGATAAASPIPTGDAAAAAAADPLTEQLMRASSRVPAAPTLPLSAAAQNPDSILRSFLGADAAWGGGGGTPAGGGLRTSRLSLKLASTTTRTASAPTPAAPVLPVPDARSPERRRDSAGGGGGHSGSDAAAVAAAAASLLSTSARPVPFLAGTDVARRRESGDAQAHPPPPAHETPAELAAEDDSGGGGELLGRINGVSQDTPLVPVREDGSEPEDELIGHSKMVRPSLGAGDGAGDRSAGSSLYDAAAPQRQRLVLERRYSERRRTVHREPSHLGASAAAATTFRSDNDNDGDSYAAAAAATLPMKRSQPQCYLRVAGSFLEMLTEQDVRRGGTELRVEVTSSAATSASAEDTVAASLSSATPEYIVRGMRSSSPAFEAAKHKLFPPAAWILERSGRVYRCILQPYPAFETPCDVVVSLDLPTALVQVEAEPTGGVAAAALHPCSPLEFTIKSLDSHGCV